MKLQSGGIGRAMKVGKEGILGLTQAIESYLTLEKTTGQQMVERMTPFLDGLNTLTGVSAKTVWDSAGRDIARAGSPSMKRCWGGRPMTSSRR